MNKQVTTHIWMACRHTGFRAVRKACAIRMVTAVEELSHRASSNQD